MIAQPGPSTPLEATSPFDLRDIAPTLAFVRRLAQLQRPIWVRFVLVPGLTDDAGDIANIASFAAELGAVGRVDVLPFHQMGRYKWERLNLRYALPHVQPPSTAEVDKAVSIFRNAGLEAY